MGEKSVLVLPLNNYCVCLESLACVWIGTGPVERWTREDFFIFILTEVESDTLVCRGIVSSVWEMEIIVVRVFVDLYSKMDP